jgi:hypothetical protein
MNLSSFIVATFFLFRTASAVDGSFVVTPEEKRCLESTGELFKNNDKLIAARHNYATSMNTEMTSQLTMTAKYPDDKLKEYEKICYENNGILHVIKIDFFDCKLGNNLQNDVELTLKNFANCLADTEECAEFDQENLLEEAWEDLGLHCEVEDAPTNPATPTDNEKPDNTDPGDLPYNVDDDLAREEEKAAAGGADEMEKKEKAAEYTPKEQASKQEKKRSAGSRFFRFVTFVGIVGAIGYVVYDRRRYGRFGGRYPQLPFGGVATGSRFQRGMGGGDSGFVSNYNLLSGEDELNFGAGDHELQLSSNLVS